MDGSQGWGWKVEWVWKVGVEGWNVGRGWKVGRGVEKAGKWWVEGGEQGGKQGMDIEHLAAKLEGLVKASVAWVWPTEQFTFESTSGTWAHHTST